MGLGLIAATLLLISAIFYLQNSHDRAADEVANTVSENTQEERNRAFAAVNRSTIKRIESLDRRADELSATLVALDPLRAPSTKPLLANQLTEPRQRLDPGLSAFELSKQERRTPSGISERALQAYTQETGISASQIEALMQQ